jgi:hypothetical protein
MANEVYANGREIACKAGAGKTICALPDVCFTPPENPATPPGVPVPYPNTGLASDTTEGSKTVMISGKEIMLKNNSYFKTSSGDDAGCATKKGLITSDDKGKVYFTAWSMDVKFEGENVDRHLDLTTNNHAAAQPGNAPPWPFIDKMVVPPPLEEPCIVGTYDEIKDRCPKGHQAHHIVPDYTARTGTRVQGIAGQNRIPGMPSFGNGPSICLEGNARTTGSQHNVAHQCDQVIAALGQQTDNGPIGTAPSSQVVPAATQAAIDASPECEQQIRNEVQRQYGSVDPNQSMRTTQQPSAGEARVHLDSGGCVESGGSFV